jgi:EAL domain-containing protein (putative c-di-GMP-specific phosphodiesterase class I)
MYRAKKNRSGTYMIFSAEIGDAVMERTKLQNSLRDALDNDEYVLYYQPQLSAGGALLGFEALIRWRSAEKGIVPPGAFIKEAEESRLIIPIGEWVLRTACAFIRNLNAEHGERFFVSVNVSIIQFMEPDYVNTVLKALRETRLQPELLELEITESCLLFETEQVIGKLRLLSEAGVRIALDDFGTGYSSLRYLKDLPADTLKIDRYFVSSIENEKSRSLIGAIVSIGHALSMELVAEGVETAQQLELTNGLQCDRIQGFLISRPIPPDEVAAFIRGHQ